MTRRIFDFLSRNIVRAIYEINTSDLVQFRGLFGSQILILQPFLLVQQFSDMAIFDDHIWAWHHTGAGGLETRTSKTSNILPTGLA